MSEPAAPASLELAALNTTSSSDSSTTVANPAVSNAGLWAAVDRYYAGDPDPDQLCAGVASALLLVPVRSLREIYTVAGQGLRWVLAFSSETELSRFAHQRPARLPPPYWYITIRGRRLLTHHTTSLHPGTSPSGSTQGREPVGVALDIAGALPMLFSPLFDLDRPTRPNSPASDATTVAPGSG